MSLLTLYVDFFMKKYALPTFGLVSAIFLSYFLIFDHEKILSSNVDKARKSIHKKNDFDYVRQSDSLVKKYRHNPSAFSLDLARERLKSILAITVHAERYEKLVTLYKSWVQLDAYDALNVIDNLNDLEFKNELYIIALQTWAKNNEIAFELWLKEGYADERHIDALVELAKDITIAEEKAIVWVDYITGLMLSEKTSH